MIYLFTRFLVFHLQIGAGDSLSACKKGEAPKDNVMLEYSTDNGLSWDLLQEFEPQHTVNR